MMSRALERVFKRLAAFFGLGTGRIKRLLSSMGVYKLYERWLMLQIDRDRLPEHVAVILDGNRRWARRRGMKPWMGHELGARKVDELLDWCLELGIKTVTLYALSTENLYRDPVEVRKLLELLERKLKEAKVDERIHRHRVKVKMLGRRDLLPENIAREIAELEEATRGYDERYLNIALAYGGRVEIVDAVRRIAEEVRAGRISPEEIDEELFEKYLYTAHLPNPEPDLIIRTSGEGRLSGFMLWQCAYSELLFLDVYWPDFRKIDLLRAIRTYQKRQRRFGR
jgi:tritrans,polycis-undecaprenyl-diphosphate synthase [geranylgeranyl-diphosphate specific]